MSTESTITTDVATPKTAKHVTGKYTIFRIASESYGVDARRVLRIVHHADVFFFPGMPDYIKGGMKQFGKTIPVVDVLQKLGIETDADSDAESVVVVDVGPEVGLAVNAVGQQGIAATVDLTQPPVPAASPVSPCALGTAETDGHRWMLLDLDKAMEDEALRRAAAILQAACNKLNSIRALILPDDAEQEAMLLVESVSGRSTDRAESTNS